MAEIDEYAISEFTCGYCCEFACALHDLTGWPIYAEFSDHTNEDLIHAWVQTPNGRAVDINGVHSGSWARTKFSGSAPMEIRHVSREDAEGKFAQAHEYREWAASIIGSDPKRFQLNELNINERQGMGL